jgi:biotin carboxyl carrier protein
MQRRFRITVNGREYDVAVEEISDAAAAAPPLAVTMMFPASPLGAPPMPRPQTLPASAPAAAAGSEVAQLSGVVMLIDVKVGQTVKQGDRLMLLEAMKMKTPVIASRSGQVTQILIKVGDAVEGGQPLLTIA